MRAPRVALLSRALACFAALALAACGGDDEGGATPEADGVFGDGSGSGTSTSGAAPSSPPSASPTSSAAPTIALATDVDPETTTHPEVVYVLMKGKDGWTWFCTGTLVSSRTVVTAAHCLTDTQFLSWEVVAPTLAAKPRVKAASVHMFEASYKDVTKPDLGIVVLESDIMLPRYAELTDVTSRVDAGQATSGAAIVRTAEKPEAPLRKTDAMRISSTARYGYTHGYGVPLFSRGGDSGAGIFLVENGTMTHQLVAVAREPDPARKLDQLSRVEDDFAAWVKATGE